MAAAKRKLAIAFDIWPKKQKTVPFLELTKQNI
jgi:hypothetical protein